MLFKTRSAAVYGIEAYMVDVEVNISTGGNGDFLIVGLPDTAVRESRSRVMAAIRNNGFGFPYPLTVNNPPWASNTLAGCRIRTLGLGAMLACVPAN